MEKIHVYCIYFPTSNKYYIGQTNNLKRRMSEHFNSGSLICKALWKVNNWQVSILHTCKSRNDANRIEIEEIRNFNSVVPNGYNLTTGGEGGDARSGLKHSKETKRKMSISAKGNKVALGRKHSKETRERMRANHKGTLGYKYTEEQKRKLSDKSPMRNRITMLKAQRTKLINKIAKLKSE